jgi:hypothetical protein
MPAAASALRVHGHFGWLSQTCSMASVEVTESGQASKNFSRLW